MKKNSLTIKISLATLLIPTITSAALVDDYKVLVGVPGGNQSDLGTYMNSLYALSIALAALLAVVKITIAGVKWMLTDVVTTKGEAKKDIENALYGLIIILAAVLIINVINPKIAEVSIVDNHLGEGKADYGTGAVPPVNIPNGTVATPIKCVSDCVAETDDCMDDPNYVSVQQTTAGYLTCYTKPTGTGTYTASGSDINDALGTDISDKDKGIIGVALVNYFDTGDYDTLAVLLSTTDITINASNKSKIDAIKTNLGCIPTDYDVNGNNLTFTCPSANIP